MNAPHRQRQLNPRGRVKRNKAPHLLERLCAYEPDVLRFMVQAIVFTNSLAERVIRIMKVRQKISDRFRSWESVDIFCRIQSCLSTCRKNGMIASSALALLYQEQ